MTITELLQREYKGRNCTIWHKGRSLGPLLVSDIKVDTDDSIVVWWGSMIIRFRGLYDFGLDIKKEVSTGDGVQRK